MKNMIQELQRGITRLEGNEVDVVISSNGFTTSSVYLNFQGSTLFSESIEKKYILLMDSFGEQNLTLNFGMIRGVKLVDNNYNTMEIMMTDGSEISVYLSDK